MSEPIISPLAVYLKNNGEEKMTIKELYRYALNNCIETMPIQYGFVDDDGIYHPDYFRFANFDYSPNNVTMMFYVAGDKTGKTRWTFFCKYLGGESYNG